jgi:YidC/Oxa1 family membrane protein insertase
MQPGPPTEPGSEKRILLAFALTFVVIAVMQPLISRYVKPPEQKNSGALSSQPSSAATPAVAQNAGGSPASTPASTAQAASAESHRAETPGATKKNAAGTKNKNAGEAGASTQVPTKQATGEQETVVDTDLYHITFTNRGAQAKSWVLKKFKHDIGSDKALELVNETAAQQYGYPLSLWTWDENLRKQLNSVLYVSSQQGTLGAGSVLTFEYSDGGLVVRKTFSFDNTYVVRVETSVQQNGAPTAALIAWPEGFGDQTVLPSYANAMVDYQYLDSVERIAVKKISSGNTIKGPLQWAGATDQYFAAVFLPDDPQSATVVTLSNTIKIPKDQEKPDPNQTVDVPVVGMAAGSMKPVSAGRFFVGPKALKVLDTIHAVPVNGKSPDLEKLVDFGRIFGWIARPLFLWLEWTHDHWLAKSTGGWGWAIVILTVIITVAVAPLRVTSMKSALKMQKVQPQLKAIQEKYKKYKMSDPRRQDMNKEMGELYKREGINPAGGCIPLLLQMPFLVAFYSMLGVAIELRHAPWIWIKDLSGPDPLHLLPILIIVSMFWLQKLTPQGGMDPMQQKMMSFMMPVMLGVMSWSLAAGLSVYWLFSQVLSLGQQYWINNTEFGREMREAMEKRARKKD